MEHRWGAPWFLTGHKEQSDSKEILSAPNFTCSNTNNIYITFIWECSNRFWCNIYRKGKRHQVTRYQKAISIDLVTKVTCISRRFSNILLRGWNGLQHLNKCSIHIMHLLELWSSIIENASSLIMSEYCDIITSTKLTRKTCIILTTCSYPGVLQQIFFFFKKK